MAPFGNDERLIELVRENKMLYDLNHPRYTDINSKNKIWHQIAKKLMCDVSICRLRWNNIRDQYRKSLKRSMITSSSKPFRHYKYSDRLAFLNGFFQERESKHKGDDLTTDDDDTEHDINPGMLYAEVSMSPNPVSPSQRLGINGTSSPTSDPESPALALPMFCSVSSPPLPAGPCSPPAEKSLRTQHKNLPRATLTSLIEYMAKKEDESQHPIDIFLAGIATTLKNLSPYYQNLAKSELFEVAQKYEMQMMMENNEVPKGNTKNKRHIKTLKIERISPPSSPSNLQ